MVMDKFRKLFKKTFNVIGMIHTLPLPGSPKYVGDLEAIIVQAKKEAEIYAKYNVDGVIVENMHDVPYLHQKYLTPETTATMTRICTEVCDVLPSHIACGLQVLAAGNCEAVAVAQASGCDFIRAEGFVFGHIADEGYIDGCAGPLLRFRSNIKADNVLIFTDIKKKHSSHAITSDIDIVYVAKGAEFFLSDGIIVTGSGTGEETDIQELTKVKSSVKLPVLIGSGVTINNVDQYTSADAVIIGSYFKYGNRWENNIEENRVVDFMDRVNKIRCNKEN